MDHFFECVACRDGFTSVDEKVTQFGLCCRGNDGLDYLCSGYNGAIVLWNGRVVRHEKVSTGSASYFLSITVARENHFAFIVCDDCIRMGGGIV